MDENKAQGIALKTSVGVGGPVRESPASSGPGGGGRIRAPFVFAPILPPEAPYPSVSARTASCWERKTRPVSSSRNSVRSSRSITGPFTSLRCRVMPIPSSR